MPSRPLSFALAFAALAGCRSSRPADPADPEPGPPAADVLGAFDPAALAERGEAPPNVAPAAVPAVIDYGPQGRTHGGADIKIRFDRPVVALGGEDVPDVARYITIEPAIAGKASFQTPELLVFQPDESLASATTYTVRFAPGLATHDGRRVEQGVQWTFETPRPQVVGATAVSGDDGGGRDLRRDSYVVVEFDQPVALAEARGHLRATARPLAAEDGAGMPVALRIAVATRAESERAGHYYYDSSGDDPRRHFTVRARGLWPVASEITLAVTPGLRGEHGPLPLDTPWDMSFATYGPQAVVARACGESGRCGLETIGLTLRNPVLAGEARKISISPRPKNLAIQISDASDEYPGTEVAIEGRFIPGTAYTVRVAPGLRDIYGQGFPGGFEQRVEFERRPELTLSASSGTLIPARKQTFGVETRFVRALRVRHAVLAEADLVDRPWSEIPLPATAQQRRIELDPRGPTGWASTAIDVGDLTGGARGPVLVHVEAEELAPGVAGARPRTLRAMFRLTDLGPVVVGSPTQSVVQVLRLSDSTPVAGARVSRFERDPKQGLVMRELGVTDGDGALVFAPPAKSSGEATGTLLVVDPATGDRTTLTIGRDAASEPGADGRRPGERVIAQVVTDRGAYRPGETVRVVGWSAIDTPFARSGLGRLPKGTAVTFTLSDPQRATVAEREVTTSEEGKFWAELAIPAEGKLGRYTVAAKLAGGEAKAQVKVEDFRTPEFSVSASVAKRDLLIGERPRLRVAASYYFGGGVPIARLSVQTSCAPERYRPPGLDATWEVGEPIGAAYTREGPRVTFGAVTGGTVGMREVEVATSQHSDALPHRCTISAEVQDASHQGIGAETGVLLHPAPIYLAIGEPPGQPRAGDRAAIPVRAVDIAGARVAAHGVEVMAVRTWHEATYKPEGGRQVFAGYDEKQEKIRTCALDPAAAGDDARCQLPPLKEGTYTITAVADAGGGRTARSVGRFRVAGAGLQRWVAAPAPSRLEVQASARKVKPGEPIEVAVQAPWKGGRGVLVLDRRGVRDVRTFALAGAPTSFRFEADDSWTPAVHVRAFAVRPMAVSDRVRPRVEEDQLVVAQDAEHRRLTVRVDAPAQAGPGDRVELTAHVRDAAGAPVAGRVALWAVDEAVLALTDYAVPDLLPAFLPGRDAAARAFDEYARVMLPYSRVPEDPWMLDGWGFGRGGASLHGRGGGASPSIRQGKAMVTPAAREKFETTPVFLADLAADASGTARVKAALPDNLTTFRIFAVASARLADGTSPGRFGVGDARTTVTTPFIVRAAAPRQLRPGDVAEVRAIVQNFTAVDGRATVELVAHDDPETAGPELAVLSERTADVAVPAGGQAFVPFRIRADGRGAARLELRATLKAGEAAAGRDALKVALPIEPERTLTEKVAIYGSLADDRAVAIPVVLPGAVRPDIGGVSVSASASLLGGLEDAVDALVTYPYGCVEQTSSRLVPVVALAELHRTFPLGLEQDPREFVAAGVERLLAMQTRAGGFSYWPGGQDVHPYASAYATWVLTLADRAGHKVPAEALRRAIDDLAGRLGAADTSTHRWDDERLVRHAIGLHVLAEADRAEPAQLDALLARRAALPAFGRAFLLMALHRASPQRPEVQQLFGELTGDIQELPATAHVIERSERDFGGYFHSDGRSDAIVLSALLRVRPEHPLVEKLARGLLERRIGGKWRNTQENAYALVALAEYARAREAETPDFTARAWVGKRPVFEASFLGRDLATRAATATMPEILRPASARPGPGSALTVVLQREGQGRMYYRLGAEWALADPAPPAREHGLAIERALRLQDGALGGRAVGVGDTVAVDLTLSSRTRIRYVALDIPIPAGLEPIQLDLGKGQRAATLTGARGWWVSHQELRRDRVVVFADDLPPGTHHHTVSLRATSRGEYQLPPAHAEAMYMPEVWGRSAGAKVSVR